MLSFALWLSLRLGLTCCFAFYHVLSMDASLCKNGKFFASQIGAQGHRCVCYPGWLGTCCNMTYCQSFDEKGCTTCMIGMTNTSNQCRDVACTSFKPDPTIDGYQCTQRDCSSLGYYGPECRLTHCLARREEEQGDAESQMVIRASSCTQCDPGWSGPDCLVSLCRHGEIHAATGACYQPCSEWGFYGPFCNQSNALFSVQNGKRVFVRCVPGYSSVHTADCSILACAHGLVDYSSETMTCFEGSCFVGWRGSYCHEPLCHTLNETMRTAQLLAFAHWKIDHAQFAEWLDASKKQALSGRQRIRVAPPYIPSFDYAMKLEKEHVCLLGWDERNKEAAKQQCQRNGLWNGSHCHCFHGWQGMLCDTDTESRETKVYEQELLVKVQQVASLKTNASALADDLSLLSTHVHSQEEAHVSAQTKINGSTREQALIMQSIAKLETLSGHQTRQAQNVTERRAAALCSLFHLEQQNTSLTHRLQKLNDSAVHLMQQLKVYEQDPNITHFIKHHNMSHINYTDMVALSRNAHHWKREADNLTRWNGEMEMFIATLQHDVQYMRLQQVHLADKLADYQNKSAVLMTRVHEERRVQGEDLKKKANMSDHMAWLEAEQRNISDAMQSFRVNMSHLVLGQSLLLQNATVLAMRLGMWRNMTAQLLQGLQLDVNATMQVKTSVLQMRDRVQSVESELVDMQDKHANLTEVLYTTTATKNSSSAYIERLLQRLQVQYEAYHLLDLWKEPTESVFKWIGLLMESSSVLKGHVKQVIATLFH